MAYKQLQISNLQNGLPHSFALTVLFVTLYCLRVLTQRFIYTLVHRVMSFKLATV